MKAIEIDQISKVYKKGKTTHIAVEQLSFDVESGSIFGLLGPNGAGKTSIIKMLCGLLKPTTGDVKIYGNSIIKNEQQARLLLGTLLEGKRGLYWPMTVKENLTYFGKIRLMRKYELKTRIAELIEQMGLQQYEEQTVGKLSTGNQQKVALAVAMIHKPNLLLLDEPTLGLDLQAAIQLKELIIKYVQAENRTVFLTTHDMNLAEEMCDDFLILKDGKINRQFNRSIFCKYTDASTYILNVHPTDSAVIDLRSIYEEKFPYDVQALNIEVSEHKLKVTLNETGFLSKIINWLEENHFKIVDINREQIKLEDIFLNAEKDLIQNKEMQREMLHDA